MEDVESKISKIETNVGYLISDIKNIESRVETKLDEFEDIIESNLSDFESKISTNLDGFNSTLTAMRKLIESKVEVSLMLNGDENEEDLNKIIII
jgi:hypothetical protein